MLLELAPRTGIRPASSPPRAAGPGTARRPGVTGPRPSSGLLAHHPALDRLDRGDQPDALPQPQLLGPLPFSGRPSSRRRALRFGFVGAYWFVLQDVVRRYFRDDLKTSAYVREHQEIIVVVVVATMSLVTLDLQGRSRP